MSGDCQRVFSGASTIASNRVYETAAAAAADDDDDDDDVSLSNNLFLKLL